ncbi:alpha-Esterase-2 [Carabus blaptoides fortunei]
MSPIVLLFLFLISCVSAEVNVSPTVRISSGLIEGRCVTNSVSGKPYYAFQGIPYAQPPVGELRFKAPIKPKPWNGTLPTQVDGPQCVQGSGGSEDCLYLNVFTTTLPSSATNSTLLPVMLYIHGGAFIEGSSATSQYGPDFLIEKGIILVTLNYRLNVFGFLNTLDNACDANVGLKDQLSALHWVQANIAKFSGDPQKVTLAGHSAGSMSVLYFMQSNLTHGLFNRAIALSGSTLSKWGIQLEPKAMAARLARALGLQNVQNNVQLINKLRRIDATQLYNASVNYNIMGAYNVLAAQPFSPSIEHESTDAIITKCSYERMSNKQIQTVPLMIGYVSNEGLLFIPFVQDKRLDPLIYEKDPTLLVPTSFNINNTTVAADRIVDHFFKNESISNVPVFLKYTSQELVRSIRKAVELMRTNQNVYFYKYSYETDNPVFHRPGFSGVAHADELVRLFNSDYKETAADVQVREKMTTLFTNFVKIGEPTPGTDPLLNNIHWPVVSKSTSDSAKCLVIDANLHVTDNPDHDDYLFWENLYKNYARTPSCVW